MAQAKFVSIAGRARITGRQLQASTTVISIPVQVAYADFLAVLAGHPPRPIPVHADSIGVNNRADHLNEVLGALTTYVSIILDDTAQTTRGGLDLVDAEAALADLTSDLTGSMLLAGERLAGGLL